MWTVQRFRADSGVVRACVALASIVVLLVVLLTARLDGSSARADVPRGPALRVLVPAYFYPVANSPWTRLSAAAAAHPGRVWAIGNPASGPGTSADPSYTAAFASFRSSGGKLLGYVATTYGTRPESAVRADVDAWVTLYGVDGIFLDEMDNVAGAHERYYAKLHKHVRHRIPDGFVVGNPGVSTLPSYLQLGSHPASDAVCVFESSASFTAWSTDAWAATRRREQFYALPYGVGAGNWTAVVQHAFAQNVGWIYTTDDVLPNPWDTLPAYFEALVGYVDANY